jgi:FkbM family methyltransferase
MYLPVKVRKYIRWFYANINAAGYHRWKRKRMLEFYSNFIKPGDLCFDIGAFSGFYTTAFAELGARVVSIEPVERNLLELKKNAGNSKQVVILSCAVGAREGESEIRIGPLPELSTLHHEFARFNENQFNTAWTTVQKVKVTTLHQLIVQFGLPAFCKIDVEGFERNVLKTLSQPIPFVSFEFLYNFREEAIQCAQTLDQLGNVQFNYSLFEFFELEQNEWMPIDRFTSHIRKLPVSHRTGDVLARFLL